jgi:hypothetical protein
MQKYSILWVSLLILVIGGCSSKHYSVSEPKIITIKSPKLKFADTGYIRYEGEAVEAELFTAGVAVEKITIDKQVCVRAGCMSEEEFIREYLSAEYPTDTLRRILLGEPIFEGINTSEQCGGAKTQYIRNEKMDIVYRLKHGMSYFKDRTNGLIIKIENLDENQSR